MTTKEGRIGIIQLKRHSRKYLGLSPEQTAEAIKRFRQFHKRWEDKIQGVRFYHAIGLEKYDTLAIWEVKDIGDWIAFNEENEREFGDEWECGETYMGISDRYWEDAMRDSDFFHKLAKAVYG